MRAVHLLLPVLLLLSMLAACVQSESADDGADDSTEDVAVAADDPTATPEEEPEPTEAPEATETPEPTVAPEATETPESTDENGEDEGPTEHVVEIQDPHDFVPDDLEIAVGDTVTFVNTGRINHTSTLDPEIARDPANAQLPEGAETWDSGDLEPGDEFSITLEVPGEYVYFCRPHEVLGQIGTITVNGDSVEDPQSDDSEADESDDSADDSDEEDEIDDYL
jgi:plastocyanin